MAHASFSDYSASSGGNVAAGNTQAEGKDKYWSLERLKRSYLDYINSKTDEVEEQKDARRYRHASQWTAEQIKIFNRRRQPIVTYNRIGRKIDGVVGLIEKLKQSPKAFPRTPNEQAGADLATSIVRAILDGSEWKAKSYLVAQNAAVDGFGGIELLLEQGDAGDPDVTFEVVENDGFFYDPRSIRLDFSDCRFMGQGKWLDLDQAKELFPEHANEMEDAMESATDLSTNSDREQKWFITDGNIKRIRVIDEWYIMDGQWCWCIYTGNMKLEEGKSYFHDEKGNTFCKYLMFSAAVDQDGDRYGFVRNLKSAQDEINQRRSKALHLLNTRRIIAEQGAFDDLEVTRREASRPDGIVIRNKGFEAEFDDGAKNQEIQAHLEFLVDAKAEVENFGPNPALIGQGALGDKSGRAIQLLQQAGVAELGPFLLAYRGWKIRLYRACWNAAKEHWKAERYIRVTDDESSLQWVGINQVGIDPRTGMPAMINRVASLDVDIIMDEGPDSITTMADTYDALLALVQNGQTIPPEVLLELAPGIDHETKKRLIEKMQQPNPMAQLQQAAAQAEVEKIQADTGLAKAKTVDTLRGDGPQEQENPAVTMAELENKQADTAQKKAQALKTMQEAMLAPQEVAMEQGNKEREFAQKDRDAQQSAYESERDQPRRDPKLDIEFRKLELEERRMQMEREDREADRDLRMEELEVSAPDKSTPTRKSYKERKAGETAKLLENSLMPILGAFNEVAQAVQTIGKRIDDLAEDVNAPVELERGKDGRIAFVNKGKRKLAVQRDKSGRAVGVS